MDAICEKHANWVGIASCSQCTIESLRQQLAAAQAKIDSLMLEYCPEDMTQEQLEEWARHQKPVEESDAFKSS